MNPSTSFTPFVPTAAHASRKKTGHVARPPNAFLLYRSNFWATERDCLCERNHRNISRMAAAKWKLLSKAEKEPWKRQAEYQKTVHAELHPGYRYFPTGRARPSRSRPTKRNGQTTTANRSHTSTPDHQSPSPSAECPSWSSSSSESDESHVLSSPFLPKGEVSSWPAY